MHDGHKLHVRSYIGWKGERNIHYKGVETFPQRFKHLEGKSERKSPQKTIFASEGLGQQMVLEPNTRRCDCEEAEPQRGQTRGDVPHRLEKRTSASENAGTQRGVDCEIPRRLGRRTKHFFIKVWNNAKSMLILKKIYN